MKNKKGRPSIDDSRILLEVARKINGDDEITIRSAIIQSLPGYSDSNTRRLQRKWRQNGARYMKMIGEERTRVMDGTYIGIAPQSYLSIAQELHASIEKITAPMRHLQKIQEQMSAAVGISKTISALQPSGMKLAIEQCSLLSARKMLENSSIMHATRAMEEMTKRFQIGINIPKIDFRIPSINF